MIYISTLSELILVDDYGVLRIIIDIDNLLKEMIRSVQLIQFLL